MSAFSNADISALLQLLRDDVALEMPPNSAWFVGRASVGRFLAANVFDGPGVTRMVRTPTISAASDEFPSRFWSLFVVPK